MGTHLPNLIDQYLNVSQRPIASRTAGRGDRASISGWSTRCAPDATALDDIGEQLAQGRRGRVRNPGPLHRIALQRRADRELIIEDIASKDFASAVMALATDAHGGHRMGLIEFRKAALSPARADGLAGKGLSPINHALIVLIVIAVVEAVLDTEPTISARPRNLLNEYRIRARHHLPDRICRAGVGRGRKPALREIPLPAPALHGHADRDHRLARGGPGVVRVRRRAQPGAALLPRPAHASAGQARPDVEGMGVAARGIRPETRRNSRSSWACCW